MKRLFLTVLGVALIAAPALRAQGLEGIGLTVEKVNVQKLRNAIAKSDEDIADAKKNIKSATWVKRGDVFVDAEMKPVNGLYVGLDEAMLRLTYGDTATYEENISGTTYTVYPYEHFKAYVADGQVDFYLSETIIDPDALDNAYEAYAKAYELDPKTAKKVGVGLVNIRNRSIENGSAYYTVKDLDTAAENFRRAYRASAHPASTVDVDTLSLFYAGFLGTIGGDYRNALEDLNKALELDYEADGETYYYIFHSQYNLGDQQGALETLKKGVSLYPNNDSIIEGLLMMYSTGDEDPSNIIPMVLNAIEQNPTNSGLYLGLARVYDKLGETDNAISSAQKAAELAPDDFFAQYFHGLYIVKKGDDMDTELGKMTITSRDQYQKALAEVNEVYVRAFEPLEKAYSIDPDEIATVELLKNLSFRFREEPAFDQKHVKYEALYKKMSGEEE